MKRKKMPVGNSDFKEIIEENYYYVDKSLLIQELLDNGSKITLITRPRRFGKTLNLMMLKYWFEKYKGEFTWDRETTANNSELFKHLQIWKLGDEYTRHCGKYPLVFLTFKDVKSDNWESWQYLLKKTIATEYERHKYLLDSNILADYQKEEYKQILTLQADEIVYTSSLKNLITYLSKHYKEKVVVLIDEYDTPVHESYSKGYYERIVNFLRSFLGTGLKDNPNLQLSVITGILRVSRENIFSDLNNPAIFTILECEYADKFGILESEVNEILKEYGIEEDIEKVRHWYNGYVIGDTKNIYNPWSIINYVQYHRNGLKPYWVNTSSNQMIKDLMARGHTTLKKDLELLIRNQPLEKKIDPHIVFKDLEKSAEAVWTLFLFSGYLKVISRRIVEEDTFLYTLSIPNLEVRTIFRKFLEQWLTDYLPLEEIEIFIKSLTNGDTETFEDILQKYVLQSTSYFDKDETNPEKVYHSFVLGLLVHLSGRYTVKSNAESGHGRYDISLIPQDKNTKGVILEFKVVNRLKKETLESAVESALKQIEEKQYETELKSLGIMEVYKYGVAFEGKMVKVKKSHLTAPHI